MILAIVTMKQKKWKKRSKMKRTRKRVLAIQHWEEWRMMSPWMEEGRHTMKMNDILYSFGHHCCGVEACPVPPLLLDPLPHHHNCLLCFLSLWLLQQQPGYHQYYHVPLQLHQHQHLCHYLHPSQHSQQRQKQPWPQKKSNLFLRREQRDPLPKDHHLGSHRMLNQQEAERTTEEKQEEKWWCT